MSRRPALNSEQIEEAQKLRSKGYSKKQLADYFNVGQTTIWENIYRPKEQKLIEVVIIREPLVRCRSCKFAMTKVIKDDQLPFNYNMGEVCLDCYLDEVRGIIWL